jgi:peptidoglycan/xylan/chitin deacetylase (PgdA/CDA1 family)
MSLLEDLQHSNDFLWKQFTKEEEYNPLQRDSFGRFSYFGSAYENCQNPTVSEFLIENGLEVFYPEGKSFAVCLTHDVDQLNLAKRVALQRITHSVSKFRLKSAIVDLLGSINSRFSPLRNFQAIIDLERQYDAKSSFFFLAQTPQSHDFRYPIENLEMNLNVISDSGFEIGLHGGLTAYNKSKQMLGEKERLERIIGKPVIGYRNHYLCFEVPTTWDLLSRVGFDYDVTFGYHDQSGFRNGMCHPFKPYNLINERFINIIEIPLVVMDTTIFGYSRLSLQDAWKMIRRLIDVTKQLHGTISILWHNARMWGDMLKLYHKILNYCFEKNAWLCSGQEACTWWTQNKLFGLI